MNPISTSRSEISREILALGGTIVTHHNGIERVHQPPGSRSSVHKYARIRRLAVALYAARADDWGVAVHDHAGWRIIVEGLSKATAALYAEAMSACDCVAIAVRRFQ